MTVNGIESMLTFTRSPALTISAHDKVLFFSSHDTKFPCMRSKEGCERNVWAQSVSAETGEAMITFRGNATTDFHPWSGFTIFETDFKSEIVRQKSSDWSAFASMNFRCSSASFPTTAAAFRMNVGTPSWCMDAAGAELNRKREGAPRGSPSSSSSINPRFIFKSLSSLGQLGASSACRLFKAVGLTTRPTLV
jgi:hypothetical protein